MKGQREFKICSCLRFSYWFLTKEPWCREQAFIAISQFSNKRSSLSFHGNNHGYSFLVIENRPHSSNTIEPFTAQINHGIVLRNSIAPNVPYSLTTLANQFKNFLRTEFSGLCTYRVKWTFYHLRMRPSSNRIFHITMKPRHSRYSPFLQIMDNSDICRR